MKKILLGIVIVILLIAGMRLLSPEDDWICKNGEWIKHGNPSAPAPDTMCEKD